MFYNNSFGVFFILILKQKQIIYGAYSLTEKKDYWYFYSSDCVFQETLRFIESAKEGLIYFSLGTVVPAHDFQPEMLKIFVNVFKKLPQKILWKVELENIPGLSSNVKLVNFAPQITVLGEFVYVFVS